MKLFGTIALMSGACKPSWAAVCQWEVGGGWWWEVVVGGGGRWRWVVVGGGGGDVAEVTEGEN